MSLHPSSTVSIPIGARSDALELTDISQTPGGTIYGTTPGGTRRIYQRNVLMTIRNSPHARTPPVNLPNIPGVTKGATDKVKKPKSNEPNGTNEHDDIFQME